LFDIKQCITATSTRALTHISIISYDTNETIYDTLVKPPDPITDYLTRFSGVTEERLRNVTTTLEDVQAFLTKLLSPPLPPSSPAWEPSFPTISSPPPKRKPKHGPNANDGDEDDEFETPILLGHSLNSDLQALKLRHPRCIDTSVIFHHPRGVPYKPGLAWLTRKWLGREIQAAGGGMGVGGLEGGHDPEEDARACVDLLRKKIENGGSIVRLITSLSSLPSLSPNRTPLTNANPPSLSLGPGFGEFKTDLESIFERIARAPPNPALSSAAQLDRRRSAVVDHGNPANWYGKKAEKSIACEIDEEVLRGVLGVLSASAGGGKAAESASEEARKKEEYSFVFARFTELADGLGCKPPLPSFSRNRRN
jgi:RNA exonuclease 1